MKLNIKWNFINRVIIIIFFLHQKMFNFPFLIFSTGEWAFIFKTITVFMSVFKLWFNSVSFVVHELYVSVRVFINKLNFYHILYST